jgi:hypothetical protein
MAGVSASTQQRVLSGAQARMSGGRGALTGAAVPSVAGDLNCAGRSDDMVRKRPTTARCAHMLQMLRRGAPSVARSRLPDFACCTTY